VQGTKPDLASFLDSIERLESIVSHWDDSHRQTLLALRESIEELHKEAFSRLILLFKADPSTQAVLRQAASDEVVYAVLRHLGLVKPSLNERVEAALSSVRPFLQSHGGNVELAGLYPPDTVEIRLLGTCDGCPSSNLTLTEGVEKAIREQCPEILTINTVRGLSHQQTSNGVSLHLISPFAKPKDPGWQVALRLADIPQDGILVIELYGHSLLFSRQGLQVSCFENACAHMGMSLEMGEIHDGILTCPYHGFQYSLSTGECLTAPEVQLVPHEIRVTGPNVEIQISK
jgi:Fe-S cluster biogenesis protein NfuA/nitrite reductase/ring-hydroxylating ferredoxin subunit